MLMDKETQAVLDHFEVVVCSLSIADLEPSEWDTWEDAIVKLKIRTDYEIDRTPILCDYWCGSDISVMDGHHRTASAIARGEDSIDAILLPIGWKTAQRDEFWGVFNHRDCGMCEDDFCQKAKIIVDNA